MHRFWVCTYKSQDFAQSQTNFARSHDRETVTFRNSVLHAPIFFKVYKKYKLIDNVKMAGIWAIVVTAGHIIIKEKENY